MKILRKSWIQALCVAGGLAAGGVTDAIAQEPGRIRSAISSPAGLKADLKYLVVDLGGNPDAYTDIVDTLDVFLIGVDEGRPVALDGVLDDVTGKRKNYVIPIANLREFLRDNLEPVGIRVTRRKTDLYELNGQEALNWTGWLKSFPASNYAVISTVRDDADTHSDPDGGLQSLFTIPADSVFTLDNTQQTATGQADRKADFDKQRTDVLESLKRRTDESPAEFELRQVAVINRLARMERLYLDTAMARADWTTDAEKGEGRGTLTFTALKGSSLQEAIAKADSEPSRFAGIARPQEYVVTTRVNFPIDQFEQERFAAFYEKLRPALNERLAKSTDFTAEEIPVRQQIGEKVIDLMQATLKLGTLQAYIDTIPSGSGTHSVVGAIRVADGAAALEILKLMPGAHTGWKVEEAIETVGQVTIHKIDLSADLPEYLREFYGPSGTVYIGTSTDTVWIAGGDGSLERLKRDIETVAATQPVSDGVLLSSQLRLGPIAQHLHDLGTQRGFNITEFLGKVQDGRNTRENARVRRNEQEGEDASTRDQLKNIKWEDQLRDALDGVKDDVIDIEWKVSDGKVTSTTHVQRGVLVGVGRVIGKVATELFGG